MPVRLQLALDTLDDDHALELARLTAAYVDIIEAGTPLIKSVGIGVVSKLKAVHPNKLILADLKSSDVGAYEANMAFKAGADIVTTQGITTLATIAAVQREAGRWGRRAEVDMTGVKDPVARAKEAQAVGVSLVLYHRSIDEETNQRAMWDERACQIVQEMCALDLDVAIAGGVDIGVLDLVCKARLYSVVVGRGITAQPDPVAAARAIAQRVREIWPS
jgi:3-hexulose-6-phosphate synthase